MDFALYFHLCELDMLGLRQFCVVPLVEERPSTGYPGDVGPSSTPPVSWIFLFSNHIFFSYWLVCYLHVSPGNTWWTIHIYPLFLWHCFCLKGWLASISSGLFWPPMCVLFFSQLSNPFLRFMLSVGLDWVDNWVICSIYDSRVLTYLSPLESPLITHIGVLRRAPFSSHRLVFLGQSVLVSFSFEHWLAHYVGVSFLAKAYWLPPSGLCSKS